MNLSFYTAAAGAQQQQSRLDVHANNIANVNTNGFRAERPVFSALMYGSVQGIDGATLPRGAGGYLSAAGTNFNASALNATGYAQDYAISGSGFFALLDGKTNEFSFTRDGAFTVAEFQRVNDEGEMESRWFLSDGEGRYVLGSDGSPIEVEDAEATQPVGVFDFLNHDGMRHVGGGRFLPVEKNGQVQMGDGEVVQGYLEVSNADLATELVKVIEAQRSFSYALKMVQTSDELETTVNGLR